MSAKSGVAYRSQRLLFWRKKISTAYSKLHVHCGSPSPFTGVMALKVEAQYSKTSLNRTLLFQKVVRFSKILVYTKCRIAPPNRAKFGLGGGFSDVSDCSSKPSEVRISARAVECSNASKWTCKPNMKARKLQVNPNIVRIAPRLTEIRSV